jgi:hypothetical protein
MTNKLQQRLGALALVAVALTAVHGKSTDTHGPVKGPKAPANSMTVDGGGRSFG